MSIEVGGGKRIAVNTVVSYSRSVIAIFLVLFSSRWVLQSLGAVDFGIYTLVGSVLAVVVFLNTVLSSSDSRFFAVSIGENNELETKKLFNTSLSLHLVLPLIIVVLGTFMGEWILENYLVIPSNRMQTALWVFRLTMLTSFISMATIPFSTILIASQNIVEYTILNLLMTFMMFLSAFFLRYSFITDDKLLLYALLMSGSYIIYNVLTILLSSYKFKFVRIDFKYFFQKDLSLSIIKYSFWNMLGDLGHLVRTQGLAIVVNLFFGPVGNAALGIANQVSAQVSNLTNAMSTATSPEIYRRVGEGNNLSAINLSLLTSKIGVFLLAILGIPAIVNMDSLLELWLINVPEGSGILCSCFILMFVIEKLTVGQYYYLQAVNKIAQLNILVFLFYCSSVVLPFCGLVKFGMLGIGISCILSMFGSRSSVLYYVKRESGFNMMDYSKQVFLPSLVIIMIIILLLAFNLQLNSISIYYLLINGLFAFFSTAFVGGVLLFRKNELLILKDYFRKK